MDPSPVSLIESLALELLLKGQIDPLAIERSAATLVGLPGGSGAADELRRLAASGEPPMAIVAGIQALAERLRPAPGEATGGHFSWDRSVGAMVAGVFIDEARGRVDELEHALLALEQHADDRVALDTAFRALHNLKGEAAALEIGSLRELAHRAEDLLAAARSAGFLPARHGEALLLAVDGLRSVIALVAEDAAQPSSDPVPLPRAWHRALAAVVDPDGARSDSGPAPALAPADAPAQAASAASLALPAPDAIPDEASLRSWLRLQAVLATVRTGGPAEADPATTHAEPEGADAVRVPLVRLDRVLALVDELRRLHPRLAAGNEGERRRAAERQGTLLDRLQQESLELRLVSLADAFQRLHRTGRDAAKQVGKEVELVADHGGVELEKAVVDRLASPLMHLVRNAIDHGLEPSSEREAAGKPRHGTVTIASVQRGNRAEIAVSDDGRGLDGPRILAKARARGLWREGTPETDEHIHPLIFLPGFSTADEVSAISGRGVGLDVVRAAVQELGGAIRIGTTPGRGTRFTVEVPMSMALQDALVVSCAGRRVVVFQGHVRETVPVRADDVRPVLGVGRLLAWRGGALPLVDLHPLLDPSMRTADASGTALIITALGAPFALRIDEVLGAQRLLVRPLGEAFRANRAVLGGCLLDDGSLALVFDPVGAMRLSLAHPAASSAPPAATASP